MLWPIKGSPSEPGGTPFGKLLLLARRRKMGRRTKKIVKKALMVERDLFRIWFWEGDCTNLYKKNFNLFCWFLGGYL